MRHGGFWGWMHAHSPRVTRYTFISQARSLKHTKKFTSHEVRFSDTPSAKRTAHDTNLDKVYLGRANLLPQGGLGANFVKAETKDTCSKLSMGAAGSEGSLQGLNIIAAVCSKTGLETLAAAGSLAAETSPSCQQSS